LGTADGGEAILQVMSANRSIRLLDVGANRLRCSFLSQLVQILRDRKDQGSGDLEDLNVQDNLFESYDEMVCLVDQLRGLVGGRVLLDLTLPLYTLCDGVQEV